MGKRRKILTKEEIEKIAEYQWANIKDIMDMVLDYFNIPNYKHGETING